VKTKTSQAKVHVTVLLAQLLGKMITQGTSAGTAKRGQPKIMGLNNVHDWKEMNLQNLL